ncbi:MAG: Uma2 family endonuclease [Pirellulales bacterium]
MSTDAIHYEALSGFTPLSTLGPYRADDYWNLPEGEPVELIRGRLIVSPAPNTLHQTIVGLLTVLLFGIARRSGGRALASPVDVVLDDHTILQPDVLYVRRERRGIIQERVVGPPDLLIEVLSPSNSRRDRVDKLSLYAQYGVAEFWIVDPVERQFDFLVNRAGKFEVQPQQDNRYASPVCPELEIDLAAFWRSVDEELDTDA